MKYLLDTNIVIFLFKNQRGIKEKIQEIGLENCFISDIILAELFYGAYYSNNPPKHLSQVRNFVKLIKILSIEDAVEIFAQQKSTLRRKGTLIDDFDLLIGVTALKNELTLITNNVKHFERIEGLQVEDWTK